jgi:hypothetical protein
VGYWSTIEVPVGVICACMPAIRSIFSLVFPKMFGTTRRDKTTYGSQGYGSKAMSQIKVKQEWTVLSNRADGNTSEVELVSFDMMTKEEAPMKKVTLGKDHRVRPNQEPSADSQV